MDGILERNLQAFLKIVAARWCVGITLTTAEAATTEHLGEDIAEVREDVVGVKACARTTTALSEGIVSHAVVHGPFLSVAKHRIGFGSLLEELFGLRITRIVVGMILARDLPIGLFEFLFVGASGHPEDLVVIAGGGHDVGKELKASGLRRRDSRHGCSRVKRERASG